MFGHEILLQQIKLHSITLHIQWVHNLSLAYVVSPCLPEKGVKLQQDGKLCSLMEGTAFCFLGANVPPPEFIARSVDTQPSCNVSNLP